jgi:hypothetical protein
VVQEFHCQGDRLQVDSGPEGANVRKVTVEGLKQRINLGLAHERLMVQSADALDAVIVAFAAIAVATNTIADFNVPPVDGFIAVAR